MDHSSFGTLWPPQLLFARRSFLPKVRIATSGNLFAAFSNEKPCLFHGMCNQKRSFFVWGKTNRCMCRTTDRAGFFRSFPNIFGITTTAELQECGALGRPRPLSFNKHVTTVRWLRLLFSIPLLWSHGMAGRFEKGDQDLVTLVDGA